MRRANYKLKGALIAEFQTIGKAAEAFGMSRTKLSYIIHDRYDPTDAERRVLRQALRRDYFRERAA